MNDIVIQEITQETLDASDYTMLTVWRDYLTDALVKVNDALDKAHDNELDEVQACPRSGRRPRTTTGHTLP